MIARDDLVDTLAFRVRPRDQILDHAKLLHRAPDPLEDRRRHAVRVPIGLDQARERNLLRLKHQWARLSAKRARTATASALVRALATTSGRRCLDEFVERTRTAIRGDWTICVTSRQMARRQNAYAWSLHSDESPVPPGRLS